MSWFSTAQPFKVSILAISLLVACQTTPLNQTTPKSDFSDLETEYAPFTTQALTKPYLSRKIKRWLSTNNGPAMQREIEYARFKHASTLKDLMWEDHPLYLQAASLPEVNTYREENNLFDTYMVVLAGLPPAPLSSSPTAVEFTSFTANWHSVTNAIAYEIRLNNGAPLNVGNFTTYAFSNQSPNTDYTYEVRAINSNGPGAWSNSQTLHTKTGEFRINTTTPGFQAYPQTAIRANGEFVSAWQSNQDGSGSNIQVQRFAANGTPIGSTLQANTYTNGDQYNPSLGMDSNGNFIVSWQSNGQDGSGSGIYAQRFAADGSRIGSEFRINLGTSGDQLGAVIGMASDGRFAATWHANDAHHYGIYMRRFDTDGSPLTGDSAVNSYTTDTQYDPDLAMAPDGSFWVTWHSGGQDGSGWGVYARRYASNGNAGNEIRVNTTTAGSQRYPTVAMGANGGAVISWYSNQDGSGEGIYAQRYAANGTTVNGEFRVNSTTSGDQTNPVAGMGPTGEFTIGWVSSHGTGNDVYIQRYNSSGVAVGGELRANSYITSDQTISSITYGALGNYIIGWTSNLQDGDGYGCFGKIFNSNGELQ